MSNPKEFCLASVDPRLIPIAFKNKDEAFKLGWSEDNLIEVIEKKAYDEVVKENEYLRKRRVELLDSANKWANSSTRAEIERDAVLAENTSMAIRLQRLEADARKLVEALQIAKFGVDRLPKGFDKSQEFEISFKAIAEFQNKWGENNNG